MRSVLRVVAFTLVVMLAAPALALNDGLPPPGSTIDRHTPLATVDGFLRHAHRRDYDGAAQYLDLGAVPRAEQPQLGPRLARRLQLVLDRKLWFDYAKISKDPEGDPKAGSGVQELGTIALGPGAQAISLAHVPAEAASLVWVFSNETVRAIDPLYAAYGAPLGEWMPDVLFTRVWVLELWQWLGLLALALLSWPLSFLLERIALSALTRAAYLTKFRWDEQLVAAGRGPVRLLMFAGAWPGCSRALILADPAQVLVDVLARTLFIIALAWFALRFVRLVAEVLQDVVKHEKPEDAGRARGVQTQVMVLRRVFSVAIVVIAVALALMQFSVVRNVGVSLLASAGIAGLVVGLAAQKSISTLLAGVQLSITQPIRIGDTVIVENEWGWVEEVTLSYVVIKVWDLRRLVVPMTYFLERPFQNWTRMGAALLGTVEIRADYSADVNAFRAELKRILEGEGKALWDGQASGVVVTEAGERTMLVRALVSTEDAGKGWDLRCLVREKLIAFMRREHPEWLPRVREDARVAVGDLALPAPAAAAAVAAADQQPARAETASD